ncbi:MAG: transcription termination/antitermination protein NusA [Gemmatimonadetes bacterium]|nr:transcription termination/antitermination protein NusA [Gemmatimonadota bacterium]
MNYEIIEALRQIAQEKNVSRDLVIETLEIGLISAAKKRFNTGDNVEVEIDQASGTIRVLAEKDVVADGKLEDPGLEIDLTDAQEIDPDATSGGKIKEELPFADFGRNAIQTAKQILVQRVREAERERIFEDYQGRVGEIISGTVQQISRGDVLVNMGRTEAIVPLKEQIRKERYRQGDPIRAILVNVLRTSKGPQVVLSRTHPNLLVKLFQVEVPEIYEGVIEIKAVSREPGERAKIAVHSNDPRIDPVGACVGMKGSRVQAVVRELSNERIDIVPWTDDEAIFLSRALSPAQIKRVVVDRRNKQMAAIVDDDQLSLAIGKSGQNARLASQLTGWKVDILTESRHAEIQAEKEATIVRLADVEGIGKVMRDRLQEYGVQTANDLIEVPLDRLTTVPGLGEATASKIQEASRELVETEVEAYREEVRIKQEAEEAARAEAEAKEAARAAKRAEAEAAAAEAAAGEEALAAENKESTDEGVESVEDGPPEETSTETDSAVSDEATTSISLESDDSPAVEESVVAESNVTGPSSPQDDSAAEAPENGSQENAEPVEQIDEQNGA